MKADPISVGKVLSENHRFVVPIYQRTYAWIEKKQLDPLFAQIEDKAQERLQKGKVDFPHYMGSLLVVPEGEASFGRVQAFDVVDGQQRLTTFHLCFAALRDIARSLSFTDLSMKLESLLLHSEDLAESDQKHGRYKLQPTTADRECFREIIDLTSDELRSQHPQYFHKNGKIKKTDTTPKSLAAYWFFLTRAQAFVNVDETSARNRLLALTDADDLKIKQEGCDAYVNHLMASALRAGNVTDATKTDDPEQYARARALAGDMNARAALALLYISSRDNLIVERKTNPDVDAKRPCWDSRFSFEKVE